MMQAGSPSNADPAIATVANEGLSVTDAAIASGRLEARDGQSIRSRAARGTMITGAFMVALAAISTIKGFIVASFLSAHDYGIWGLLVITLGTLYWLAQVGFDDKYVQQDDDDQEIAFQQAFTFQCLLVGGFMVLTLAAMPLFALAYGRWDIILPAYVLGLLAMPAVALQTPLWVYFRRMEFAKQRMLQSLDPIVGLTVTVVLAALGFGYWSLVLGLVASAWATAIAAIIASPYRLALRFDRKMLDSYLSFSWPLFVSSVNGIAVAQIPILAVQRSIGVAAVGAITLAASISLATTRLDQAISESLYAAICAAKDRVDVLFESFSKSNRMALLWAVPIGVGLALFTHPLIHFVLGDRWEPATTVIQVMAVNAAINQIGFNWSEYYSARGDTRPVAVASAIVLGATLAIAVPLVLIDGLRGYAVGMGIVTLVYVAVRLVYLKQLFVGLKPMRHISRGVGPTLPAAAAVLVMRALGAPFDAAWTFAELAVFGVLVIGATAATERSLLRETVGYLRRGAPS